MTKDQPTTRLVVPRKFFKRMAVYLKGGRTTGAGRRGCPGIRRAERRRAPRSDARWQHANQVALPYRMRKVRARIATHIPGASA